MSYHERLKNRSPSASELEEQKRRMSQGPTIEELERRLQEAEQANSDTANHLGYLSGVVPIMGDDPPAPPENVIATPFYHQLDVSWSEPPEDDQVVRAFVRVKLVSDPEQEKTVEVAPYGGYVADLPAEPHIIEARFEDRWRRSSGWSAAVEAAPSLTVAESIDFTRAEIAGSLGWENLDALDEGSGLTLAERQAKLGDYVITARAMAAQNLAATRLWAQTGAFESAMITNLAVDKLMAGTFTAGMITLAGAGLLRAGGISLSASGISMPSTTSFDSPAANQDYKINVGADGWAALSGYNDSSSNSLGPVRGMGIRVDGNGNRRGVVTLQATYGGVIGANTSAQLQVIASDSGKGWVSIINDLYNQGDCFAYSFWVRQKGTTSSYAEIELRSNGKVFIGGREVAFV